MSKNDLRARPIYQHLKESIQAHLAIVFAALATWNRPPAGAPRSSSPRCAAPAPFRSKPASTPSPPKTSYPTTPKTPSTSSATTDNNRTNCHKSGSTLVDGRAGLPDDHDLTGVRGVDVLPPFAGG